MDWRGAVDKLLDRLEIVSPKYLGILEVCYEEGV